MHLKTKEDRNMKRRKYLAPEFDLLRLGSEDFLASSVDSGSNDDEDDNNDYTTDPDDNENGSGGGVVLPDDIW